MSTFVLITRQSYKCLELICVKITSTIELTLARASFATLIPSVGGTADPSNPIFSVELMSGITNLSLAARFRLHLAAYPAFHGIPFDIMANHKTGRVATSKLI